MKNKLMAVASGTLLIFASMGLRAEQVGAVDTVWKMVGNNHQVIVEVYDDPLVQGLSCYVSRAKTGGLKGTLGIAEDKSDASIACRQVGEISFSKPLPLQEDVFNERLSLLFKKLHIVRMVDPKRNVLVYMTYSDKLIEGSPQNSVSVVPVDRKIVIPVKR